MPCISYGDHITNIDNNSRLYEKLSKINKLIPNEIVVEQFEWKPGFFFSKTVRYFTVYHKTSDIEAEKLTSSLLEKEAEMFLDGLMLAWKNPIRNLKRIK